MPWIQLSFSVTALIVMVLVGIAAVIAFLFYRTTLPPVSRRKRIFLTSLRTASLSLLALLLADPILTLLHSSTQRPVLAILMDNSRSMRIVDRTTDRAAELARTLGSPSLREIARSAELRYFTFGATLRSASPPGTDTLALNEESTDISAALRALAIEKQRGRIDAALLLTDGSYNLGQNPVYDAEQLSIPVYTVGIGDSSEQKDVLITKVLANDLVYSGTPTPVDITVRSSGFGGERVDVTLFDGNRELGRVPLILTSGTHEYTVQLTYTPEGTGRRKYVARVSPLDSELTTENNVRTFFSRILKSRLRVLIIAGSPGPDLTIVRQTLTEEKNFTVQAYSQRPSSGFYEGTLHRASIDSADCLVFIGFPTAGTEEATLQLLLDAFLRDRKPLLFVHARNVDYRRTEGFRPLLPFTVESASSVEELVSFVPADAQRGNPLLRAGRDDGFESWKSLPPVFRTVAVFRAKAEASILGFTARQGVTLPEPFMLTRSVNREKSLAILAYGIWRWRLMTHGNPATGGLFFSFLSGSIQWLTSPDENRPVRVATTKEVFTRGEPVEFAAQVYDASGHPVQNGQVHIVIQQGEKSFEGDLRPVGNGRYEGNLDGLDEGDYLFHATAQSDGMRLGEDTGRFSVGRMTLESQETHMNAPVLRELARRTEAKFFVPGTIDTLTTALFSNPVFVPIAVQKSTTVELRNWYYVLGCLIFLFAVEWFVRKRSGML